MIRVSQTYDAPSLGRIINKLLLAEAYANLERHFQMALYRKSDARIYTLEIPQPLKDQGWLVRYLEVKHNAYGVINPDAWNVEIEVWQGTDPAGNVGLIADGGIYDGL